MEERIYNCYVIVENEMITEIGLVEHLMKGNDDELELFLKDRAGGDFTRAELFSVPEHFIVIDMFSNEMYTGIPWQIYRGMLGTDEEIMIFEKGFQTLQAPLAPMINISVVFGGTVMASEAARGARCLNGDD
jgi:hypothetical protein